MLATYQKHFDSRDPVKEPGTKGGTPGNWWTVYALDPELFGMFLDRHKWQWSKDRKLDPVLRELGIARAGWARGSRFVFSQHCKVLRREGCLERKIEAIPTWSSADCYSDIERAILGYTDDLVLGGGRTTDERLVDLRKQLDDVQIFELTFMVLTYDMSATLCKALRLEYDDVEERVTEVKAGEYDLERM
ncbi:carboxymuconolactone decarboxylase family protein [Paraburkholderia sediminicola]|uniref:carboxymuconolactone decarboxylase family protein n=1 Tax=Paraburkholderia sediminicola TaxID=458836 RepID=UPI0038BC5DC8